MEEIMFFTYEGKPFICIREDFYHTIAEDLRTKCIKALRPFANEIVDSEGSIHFEFDRGFKGARVRMKNMGEDLQRRIAAAIPSLNTL
jgi:hypothetical protein